MAVIWEVFFDESGLLHHAGLDKESVILRRPKCFQSTLINFVQLSGTEISQYCVDSLNYLAESTKLSLDCLEVQTLAFSDFFGEDLTEQEFLTYATPWKSHGETIFSSVISQIPPFAYVFFAVSETVIQKNPMLESKFHVGLNFGDSRIGFLVIPSSLENASKQKQMDSMEDYCIEILTKMAPNDLTPSMKKIGAKQHVFALDFIHSRLSPKLEFTDALSDVKKFFFEEQPSHLENITDFKFSITHTFDHISPILKNTINTPDAIRDYLATSSIISEHINDKNPAIIDSFDRVESSTTRIAIFLPDANPDSDEDNDLVVATLSVASYGYIIVLDPNQLEDGLLKSFTQLDETDKEVVRQAFNKILRSTFGLNPDSSSLTDFETDALIVSAHSSYLTRVHDTVAILNAIKSSHKSSREYRKHFKSTLSAALNDFNLAFHFPEEMESLRAVIQSMGYLRSSAVHCAELSDHDKALALVTQQENHYLSLYTPLVLPLLTSTITALRALEKRRKKENRENEEREEGEDGDGTVENKED
ncbi:hypothetical protein BLNAU_221 [Blattamonas nauphoetae]|uniref:Apea-like HEPN domain-containing protein n=1 Tax=Blattamonas nauphoetae TaxID=2049346 RepID=A0ABQ9YMC5_9EUKA|nr:hypothetical protein BLNAU_221 [Blattamonas nauphoetae]